MKLSWKKAAAKWLQRKRGEHFVVVQGQEKLEDIRDSEDQELGGHFAQGVHVNFIIIVTLKIYQFAVERLE